MKMQSLSTTIASVIICLLADHAALAEGATPDHERPNVLFVVVDDLRPQLGCYGHSQMKTPHMDTFAKGGLLFNQAFCQQAVCSPSRISVLTGRRPDTTKIYDLQTHNRKTMPDVVTLPQHFKNNGYHSQGFGKVYHGGLDDELSWSVPHTPNRAMQYADPEIIATVKRNGAEGWEQGGKNKGPALEVANCADNELPDGYIADKAIHAMRAVRNKPFFIAVGFEKPHLPFVAPQKYFEPYPLEAIHLPTDQTAPDGAPDIALTNWSEMRPYQGIPKQGPLTNRQAKELIRAYYAAVSFADAQVGRILDELNKLGLSDNTIVILWGDHGYQLGEQGLWCKHTNYENSTRTVLMIRAPGHTRTNTHTDALVELIDIYPTLCELVGLTKPSGLEGTSFVPLLTTPERTWKRAVFSQYPRNGNNVMGYSVRTARYRYTEWRNNWRTPEKANVLARELYDHKSDPRETRNVADLTKYARDVQRLSLQLKDGWRAAAP
jgi:arylsulfatase A-like enzyme